MAEQLFAQSAWYVYMLRCADGSLYTGITTDPQRRLRQHRGELKGGARYTRSRLPLTLVWLEPQQDRGAATRREMQLKSLKASEKEALLKEFYLAEDFS